ncbi:MAG: tRNA (N(6)-L-threonylcarbamoyladenosine(37)-C(2))-methylthiotransferase MtaB [Parachlamydiaceae bacterium]|nr:tRNA (N(6)-L-threonylcarbamoyladenosine(37)-C(2))-methylthiotransferase MtaB [Parachlamydiaceae bacterium]
MEEKNKKFKIVTLGCRTNQYESQAFQDQLKQLGYTAAQDGEQAEICIVNTCTVTESADSSSRHSIRQLAKDNPHSKLLVTGCYAERNPDAIKSIEGVSHVIPNAEKENLLAAIFPEENLPEFTINHFDSHTRAFVKVQDGCNSFCTYCIIPYVRGRSHSRTVPEILNEVQTLISNGFKEVVITGINVGDFDGGVEKEETPVRLSELIRLIDAVPGLQRLRVSSIDPDEVDDDLADAILNGKNTCPSMHIVLQSGSNVILKRMNRKYTRQMFFETVDRLKMANPDFTFTTDIIVGFPGETDGDFQETLEVMREVKFAKVHMFPYSDRPRTRSMLMPNKVPPQVIKERKQTVLHLSEKLAFELRNSFIGRRMWVLTESMDSNFPNEITGHTHNFLPVRVLGGHFESNQLIEVDLIENSAHGLIGRPI